MGDLDLRFGGGNVGISGWLSALHEPLEPFPPSPFGGRGERRGPGEREESPEDSPPPRTLVARAPRVRGGEGRMSREEGG